MVTFGQIICTYCSHWMEEVSNFLDADKIEVFVFFISCSFVGILSFLSQINNTSIFEAYLAFKSVPRITD